MESKNLVIAALILVLVLFGSFMLWNKVPERTPINPVPPTDVTKPVENTTPKTVGGGGICMDPSNKYSIPNKNGCKNANDLGTCKLDLNGNGVSDVDEICGAGFQKCCCAQGYSNCC